MLNLNNLEGARGKSCIRFLLVGFPFLNTAGYVTPVFT